MKVRHQNFLCFIADDCIDNKVVFVTCVSPSKKIKNQVKIDNRGIHFIDNLIDFFVRVQSNFSKLKAFVVKFVLIN